MNATKAELEQQVHAEVWRNLRARTRKVIRIARHHGLSDAEIREAIEGILNERKTTNPGDER